MANDNKGNNAGQKPNTARNDKPLPYLHEDSGGPKPWTIANKVPSDPTPQKPK